MIGLGIGFLGSYDSIEATPTKVEDIDYVSLSNCKADYMYMAKNANPLDENLAWDNNTVLFATFNQGTLAGNADFTIETVSDIYIKKRKVGDYKWRTVYTKKITAESDFDISGIDYLSSFNQDWQYSIVGVLNGVEGNYHINEIFSESDQYYIVDRDSVYGTLAEQGTCDTTRSGSGSYLETFYSKYPTKVKTSKACFDTGSMKGLFIKFNADTCTFETSGLQKYRREIVNFLSNEKQKVLKLPDGRMWLISVDPGSITDVQDSHQDFRIISFSWTETGDCESDEALYYAGLSDITSEHWVS